MPTGEVLVEVRALSYSYAPGTPLEVRALESVSMEVRAGEAVGIIGPNGSGKSTLLCHMNGIYRSQQGEVLVKGRPLSDPAIDIREVRREVGLVFQNPEDQLFERFAGDDVAFGPRNLGLSKDEIRKRVKDAMEAVGLPFSYKDRLTEELSRGEKRRLALAGILAMAPDVLVLDEPMANLDPAGRRDMTGLLRRWLGKVREANEQGGGGACRRNVSGEADRAMVLVSHSIEEIVELADRVYLLAGGRVVAAGAVREVCARHDILSANGIEEPFAAGLMRELAIRLGFRRPPRSALTIEEAAERIGAMLNG